jgi:hypothetical protein
MELLSMLMISRLREGQLLSMLMISRLREGQLLSILMISKLMECGNDATVYDYLQTFPQIGVDKHTKL